MATTREDEPLLGDEVDEKQGSTKTWWFIVIGILAVVVGAVIIIVVATKKDDKPPVTTPAIKKPQPQKEEDPVKDPVKEIAKRETIAPLYQRPDKNAITWKYADVCAVLPEDQQEAGWKKLVDLYFPTSIPEALQAKKIVTPDNPGDYASLNKVEDASPDDIDKVYMLNKVYESLKQSGDGKNWVFINSVTAGNIKLQDEHDKVNEFRQMADLKAADCELNLKVLRTVLLDRFRSSSGQDFEYWLKANVREPITKWETLSEVAAMLSRNEKREMGWAPDQWAAMLAIETTGYKTRMEELNRGGDESCANKATEFAEGLKFNFGVDADKLSTVVHKRTDEEIEADRVGQIPTVEGEKYLDAMNKLSGCHLRPVMQQGGKGPLVDARGRIVFAYVDEKFVDVENKYIKATHGLRVLELEQRDLQKTKAKKEQQAQQVTKEVEKLRETYEAANAKHVETVARQASADKKAKDSSKAHTDAQKELQTKKDKRQVAKDSQKKINQVKIELGAASPQWLSEQEADAEAEAFVRDQLTEARNNLDQNKDLLIQTQSEYDSLPNPTALQTQDLVTATSKIFDENRIHSSTIEKYADVVSYYDSPHFSNAEEIESLEEELLELAEKATKAGNEKTTKDSAESTAGASAAKAMEEYTKGRDKLTLLLTEIQTVVEQIAESKKKEERAEHTALRGAYAQEMERCSKQNNFAQDFSFAQDVDYEQFLDTMSNSLTQVLASQGPRDIFRVSA